MKSFATLATIGTASAGMSLGACPTPTYVENFDSAAFAGKWYEQARDSVFMYEMRQECGTQRFTLQDDGSLDLYFRAWFPMMGYNGVDGTLFCQDGSADT